MSPQAGTAEANVVVRVARSIVQIQRLNPIVRTIVPIAAAYETGPLYIRPIPCSQDTTIKLAEIF
jgi:hypothetical protein